MTPLFLNTNQEILKTISKAKEYYPNLTKLLLYTNEEWGQYKGREPQGLKEIEEKAEELELVLEWRSRSFFESEFVCETNRSLAKHFFTCEKNIISLLEELTDHSQNILSQIRTSISFKGKKFEIDRGKQLKEIQDKSQQVSIISGVGGVGKTAIIKELLKEHKGKGSIYCIQSNRV